VWTGYANISVYTESERTRNADEKHVGTSHTHFHEYYNGKAVCGKDKLGDIDVNVIEVYSTVFIISHYKLTYSTGTGL